MVCIVPAGAGGLHTQSHVGPGDTDAPHRNAVGPQSSPPGTGMPTPCHGSKKDSHPTRAGRGQENY